MESIKNWFQDWSDACEYAKECVPDFSFMVPQEPLSALVSIAAVCLVLWWWSERKIVSNDRVLELRQSARHASQELKELDRQAVKTGLFGTIVHAEKHFLGSESVRDVVIGMADGLTAPFALAAGISAAIFANG